MHVALRMRPGLRPQRTAQESYGAEIFKKQIDFHCFNWGSLEPGALRPGFQKNGKNFAHALRHDARGRRKSLSTKDQSLRNCVWSPSEPK